MILLVGSEVGKVVGVLVVKENARLGVACPLCYNAAGVIQTVTRRVVNRNPPTKIEKGETPEQAAARELMEATGHRAVSLSIWGVIIRQMDRATKCFTFSPRAASRTSAKFRIQTR